MRLCTRVRVWVFGGVGGCPKDDENIIENWLNSEVSILLNLFRKKSTRWPFKVANKLSLWLERILQSVSCKCSMQLASKGRGFHRLNSPLFITYRSHFENSFQFLATRNSNFWRLRSFLDGEWVNSTPELESIERIKNQRSENQNEILFWKSKTFLTKIKEKI